MQTGKLNLTQIQLIFIDNSINIWTHRRRQNERCEEIKGRFRTHSVAVISVHRCTNEGKLVQNINTATERRQYEEHITDEHCVYLSVYETMSKLKM